MFLKDKSFFQAENSMLNLQLKLVSDDLEKNKIKYHDAMSEWQHSKQHLQVRMHWNVTVEEQDQPT